MAASLTTYLCDITECSKCHQLLNKPRSLPCLHSYCTQCLETVITGEPPKTKVACVICGEEFDIPAGGVKEWQSLSIVRRLTEQKAMQIKLTTKGALHCNACAEVEAGDSNGATSEPPTAVARCTECDDYLCKRCVAIHKSQRALKNHPVFTLDELRAGKASDIGVCEQKICLKHKGEVLLFYCETCDVPICRQCVVIAHRHPEHKQSELEQAAIERNGILQQLRDASNSRQEKLDKELHEIRESIRDLDKAVSEARCKIKETVEEFKSSYMNRLDKAQKHAEDELNTEYSKRSTTLKTTKSKLMSTNSRMSTAVTLTKQLLDSGTDLEIASDFSSLKGVMKTLSDTEPSANVKSIKEVGGMKFIENKQTEEEIILGKLTGTLITQGGLTGTRRTRKTCDSTLNMEFGNAGIGKLSFALDVAVTAGGDLAVTNHNAANVKVYSAGGVFKSSFNLNAGVGAGKTSNPWCIQVGPDNLFYVTDYSPNVKIFDMQGTYKRYFFTVSPEKVSYKVSGSSEISGLSFNSKGEVLAGNVTHNFISRHALDGTHLSSIKVAIKPLFLAVTSDDLIIVSQYIPSGIAHIIDQTGAVLAKLQTPAGVTSWRPAGLVVSSHQYTTDDDKDEIFVADQGNGHAVYRYSSSGKYIDCVTKDVSNTFGLTLSANEQQLIVACVSTVKCFDI